MKRKVARGASTSVPNVCLMHDGDLGSRQPTFSLLFHCFFMNFFVLVKVDWGQAEKLHWQQLGAASRT